jgi:hypothetical protein
MNLTVDPAQTIVYANIGLVCASVYLTTFSFTAKDKLFQGIFTEFFFMCSSFCLMNNYGQDNIQKTTTVHLTHKAKGIVYHTFPCKAQN